MTFTPDKARSIKTETELLTWLRDRTGTNDPATLEIVPDIVVADGGLSIIEIVNRWEGTHRYVEVAFRSGEIHFTSLPACVTDLGVKIAVRVPDRHRYDLVALAKGFL